jgi:hypothetical protein
MMLVIQGRATSRQNTQSFRYMIRCKVDMKKTMVCCFVHPLHESKMEICVALQMVLSQSIVVVACWCIFSNNTEFYIYQELHHYSCGRKWYVQVFNLVKIKTSIHIEVSIRLQVSVVFSECTFDFQRWSIIHS